MTEKGMGDTSLAFLNIEGKPLPIEKDILIINALIYYANNLNWSERLRLQVFCLAEELIKHREESSK